MNSEVPENRNKATKRPLMAESGGSRVNEKKMRTLQVSANLDSTKDSSGQKAKHSLEKSPEKQTNELSEFSLEDLKQMVLVQRLTIEDLNKTNESLHQKFIE